MNYGWLDPLSKVCRQPIGTSRRGGETSRRSEVLWLVGLHVEVRYCDLDE